MNITKHSTIFKTHEVSHYLQASMLARLAFGPTDLFQAFMFAFDPINVLWVATIYLELLLGLTPDWQHSTWVENYMVKPKTL